MAIGMTFSFPVQDALVAQEIRAFLVSLSHLPVEIQLDLLRDATSQISQAVEQTLA